MKKFFSDHRPGLVVGVCFVLALAVLFSWGHAQLTQGWTRDTALHVTATATAATTDLRGTVTTGWDKVVVHNKDATIWVGVYVITKRLSEAFGVDTFAAMLIFVPPDGSLTIEDEDVIALRHITESSTADLIIERHEKI